jgi:antitoxin ParD1/3/4
LSLSPPPSTPRSRPPWSGDYATTSEVIRTALREWELKEEMRRLEGERIAKLWDEGLASGPARERNIDDILDEAKTRLAKNQAAE